jgi:uncharacterized protein YqeY
MNISEKIEADLKQALLSGDKAKVSALRNIKSALQYEAVAAGVKDEGLSEEQSQKVLAREAKKRVEAAEAYDKAGLADRAALEQAEKTVIDSYLPEQVSEAEIAKAIDEEAAKLGELNQQAMGKLIGAVRGRLGAGADGATIARLVKEKIGA